LAELSHWHDLAEKANVKNNQVQSSAGTQANESITIGDEEAGISHESSDDDDTEKKFGTSADLAPQVRGISLMLCCHC
jgi:hypothetical protein